MQSYSRVVYELILFSYVDELSCTKAFQIVEIIYFSSYKKMNIVKNMKAILGIEEVLHFMGNTYPSWPSN